MKNVIKLPKQRSALRISKNWKFSGNQRFPKSMHRLNKIVLFEISKNLSLKSTLKLSGVCKRLRRLIRTTTNANGVYIYLKKDIISANLYTKFAKTIIDDDKQISMDILIKAGAHNHEIIKNDASLLMQSAMYGYPNLTRILLENGENPNYKDSNGQTALFYAVRTNHIDVITILLENGADINIKSYYEETALSIANDNDQTEIINILTEHIKGLKMPF